VYVNIPSPLLVVHFGWHGARHFSTSDFRFHGTVIAQLFFALARRRKLQLASLATRIHAAVGGYTLLCALLKCLHTFLLLGGNEPTSEVLTSIVIYLLSLHPQKSFPGFEVIQILSSFLPLEVTVFHPQRIRQVGQCGGLPNRVRNMNRWPLSQIETASGIAVE
jgi:hypothetical protein